MKKLLSASVFSLGALVLLAGCDTNNAENFIGTWKGRKPVTGKHIEYEIKKGDEALKIHRKLGDGKPSIYTAEVRDEETLIMETGSSITYKPDENQIYSKIENVTFDKVD